ncbi:MAG: glycosyltransferase family 2 protein [Candidatus Kapaibacteriota bacterium]
MSKEFDKEKNINYNKRKQNQFYGDKGQQVYLSIVIPLLNEEESIPELVQQIVETLAENKIRDYEIIFIDDGSTDNSYKVIKDLSKENSNIHCIKFRRNYGKSAALSVGFAQAQGKYVITMDADLQDDPKEIPNLIEKLNMGYDLVSGWKKKRYDPISKTIPSKFFNYVTSIATGVRLHDFNCGLKAYKRSVVKTVLVYGEMHRYIPALAHLDGFKVTEIPVQHHPRKYGKTKFGLSRFIYGFLDLLTVLVTVKYMKRPLHFFGTLGVLLTLIGFITNLALSIEWFMGSTSLSNRPLLWFGIASIIVGIQFISLGLLGELMTKHQMMNNKNMYNISDKF